MPVKRRGKPFGYLLDPVFLLATGAYLVNRLFIKPHLSAQHVYSPLFHGHFNDSLIVPVALPLFLLVYRLLGLRPDDAPPRWWEVALHVAVWSLFFKWYAPVVLHHGQSDPTDILCYAGGGVVAWLLWQRKFLAQPFASATGT